MSDLCIQFGGHSTIVAVRVNILADVGSLLRMWMSWPRRPQAVLITDGRVGLTYAGGLRESLRTAEFRVLEYRVEPGEASKSLDVVDKVYRFLSDKTVGRDCVVVALGGGVVSDLSGFVAATWMRGVRFAVCPTTLEADIDASIGGKTAINVPGGKNLVGAFHQPVLVAVDPACLKTLDARDVRAGVAESVKHALISSEEFLAWHEANVDAILALDEPAITELILKNLRIKAKIVERDPYEQGDRRVLLNFGHTIGHAIEACSEFALRHGECVALGMLAACRLSHATGLLDQSLVTRVATILGRFGLPTELQKQISSDRIMATIRNDKKVRGGAQRFVLLEGVGRPTVREDVPEQEVRVAYESLVP